MNLASSNVHSRYGAEAPSRMAVFASGNGSNFQVLAEHFPDQIKFVFSDHHDAYVLKRAEILNILAHSIELRECENKIDYERKILALLDENQIDLVILAGYMKIIGPTLLAKYKGKIINIHPSYLPNFAGSPHAIEESHAAQEGLGVTVHYVDEGVDTGEIIAQEALPFLSALTDYEQSVHALEHRLYPQVIEKIIQEKC